MKYRSFKKRLLIKFGAIIAAILFIVGSVFYILFWQNSALLVKQKMLNRAEKIESCIENKREYKNLSYPFAIYKNGNEVFKSKNFKRSNLTQEQFFMPWFPFYSDDASFRYSLEEKNNFFIVQTFNVDDLLGNILITFFIIMPLIFIALLLVANSIIDTFLIPINQLNADAKRVNINNFKSSLAKTKYNDEIALLRDSFNEMIQRLNSGVSRLKRANDTIAHELKTPIAIMKSEIELAQNMERDSNYYKEAMVRVKKQVEHLESIVNTLLILSRYSKQEINKRLEMCDLNSILLNVLEELEQPAKQKGISLELKIFERASKLSHKQLLYTIMKNIIENAIKYSKNNSHVEISLSVENNKVLFTVQDWGIGIAKEDIERVTERFFKVELNDNRSFGLGLSIVKEAIALLEATLTITSQIGKGSKFIVSF